MSIPPSNPRLAQMLTYAGTLPLLGCALAAWIPAYSGIDAATIALAHGAVVAAFVSGIL
jgi:hypothetical protein